MPLNEDALRKAFFRRCEKDGSFNMAAFKTLEDGSFANTFLENLFSDFKHKCEVAYSPEVLQALGVVIQDRPLIARSLAEWHEDDGPVTWWAWCGNDWAGEPAWNGSPTDSDWPGYHTHWTPHPIQPQAIKEQS